MVIISNGHDKFILAPLAAELARKGLLSLFITGGYPTSTIKSIIRKKGFGIKPLQRLLSREEEDIPAEVIRAKNLSEIVSQAGRYTSKVFKQSALAEKMMVLALKNYARSAVKDVKNINATIYHYRSGYGLSSVKVARKSGMITLCDHSIANPEIIDYLVNNNGQWPASKEARKLTPFWKLLLEDITQADFIIVNSDFVKESFTRYGWDENRIFVNYTGIDDQFLEALPAREEVTNSSKANLLFAGEFGKRKGGEVLVEMLGLLEGNNWHMEFVASISVEMQNAGNALMNDERITFNGFMSRAALAQRMTNADVFIFPSLAEGSARVVFMALACGCYVITTKNSGTIVEDGIHGKIVPPGDVQALTEAVKWALDNPEEVKTIGIRNAALIKQHYKQSFYGNNTVRIYDEILKITGTSGPGLTKLLYTPLI